MADGRGLGHWRSGEGSAGEFTGSRTTARPSSRRGTGRVGYGMELATGWGRGGPLGDRHGRASRARRAGTVREAAAQLPRLARLEQIQPNTRISIGLLIEERRRRAPGDEFFLFEDRAYEAAR